jgi:hypothetical protein
MLRKAGAALLVAGGVVAGTTMLATPASAASATTTVSYTWPVAKKQVKYYPTPQFHITLSGSNLYIKKTDGPALEVMYYKCSDKTNHGSWVPLSNTDGSHAPWVTVATNFKKGSLVCLASYDTGGKNATDTFTATVAYNTKTKPKS